MLSSVPGSSPACDGRWITPRPLPIDGIYRKILDVRDLGSGKQLAALPVPEESGIETALLLESLVAQYGPPLVIKSDNGSSLVAAAVKKILNRFGVIFMLSPPYYPPYNSACKAGHGAIKVRAHHLAARAGRPGQWSCDDVEAARLGVNELSRAKGFGGPSPNLLWGEKKYLPILLACIVGCANCSINEAKHDKTKQNNKTKQGITKNIHEEIAGEMANDIQKRNIIIISQCVRSSLDDYNNAYNSTLAFLALNSNV